MRAVLPTVCVVVFLVSSVSPVAAQVTTAPPPTAPRTTAPPGLVAPRSNNPFLGGVPTGELTPDALSLSITDAINRALAYNLGVLLAENGVGHAQGARKRALSELLPNITGRVSETRQVVNLAAFGFPLPAGIPPIVGPFNVFDARVYLSQSVLDFKAMNDAKAETHNIAAAHYDYKTARDLVVLVATVSYAQALAASARVDATQGQVDTSQALLNQASDLKANGLVAGIDVLRAEVQLDTDRQRVTAARNEFEKSKLQLARLIGLPIGQTFTLANQSDASGDSGDDTGGGTRSRLQDAAGLSGRARTCSRGRSHAASRVRRDEASHPRDRQFRGPRPLHQRTRTAHMP